MTTTEKLKHPVTAIKQMIGKDHTADTAADVEGTNTKVSSYTNETGTSLGHHTTTTGAGSDYTPGTGVGHSHLQVSSVT
jgi:hypothetical protein